MAAQLRMSAEKGAICAVLAFAALSAPANAEILFDSLGGASSGSSSTSDGGSMDATFATGASTFDVTDIALNIGQTMGDDDSNTVTVKLVGGIPLADLSFDPEFGLNVFPGGAPLIASTTFAISDLSTGLTVEHFNEFADIPLKPDSLYWIDLTSTSSSAADAFVTWGLTHDVSGVGVAENYNSSQATDFDFFLNQGVPPFAGDVAFRMEVSGTAVPEPATWTMMGIGFACLGLASYRRATRPRAALKGRPESAPPRPT
jgi:PEP-CTERM motif